MNENFSMKPFKEEDSVVKLLGVFEFFDKHHLIDNASLLKRKFEDLIDTTDITMRDAFIHQECNQKQMEMFWTKVDIETLINDLLLINDPDLATLQKCKELFQKMKKLHDCIENMQGQNESVMNKVEKEQNSVIILKSEICLKKAVMDLIGHHNLQPFFIFGY